MQLAKSTIQKLADVLIRMGEAATIGGVATIFVKDFSHYFSILGIVSGAVLILLGLYVNNLSEGKGV